MIATVFHNEDLAAADRFEAWRVMATRVPAPTHIRSDHTADFRATFRALNLTDLHVSTVCAPPIHAQRTPKLIRQSDSELYQMELCVHGKIGISQADREATIAEHQWILQNTSRPYDLRSESRGNSPVEGVAVHVPRSLLPFPSDKVDGLLARGIPGGEGIGSLLTGFLTRLISDPNPYRPSDAPRLGTVLLDLVTALLAHELDADRLVPPETHQQTLTLRIRAFILQHLGEADLAPGTIAAAHHISTSYLHRLFQQQGLTVSAWIRGQRLERCRRDLADPALHATPIHAIAGRWGFTHAADFSRAFRTAYGSPPRDYRREALAGQAPDSASSTGRQPGAGKPQERDMP